MAYTKTTWVNDREPSINADNLNKMENGIADAQYPDGGTAGQFLKKGTNGPEWGDVEDLEWGNISGTLANQTDLANALNGKVDKVTGKQLSDENFTSILKTKLEGVQNGAEANVQANWNETNSSSDAYIQNKPTDVSAFDNDSGYLTSVDWGDIGGNLSAQSDLYTALDGKQDALSFDSAPTEDSSNPVTSGGVYSSQVAQDTVITAVSDKVDTLADIIAAKNSGDFEVIQKMVEGGLGPMLYPVGTQFEVQHTVYGTMLWDVLQHITPDSDPLFKAMLPVGKDYGMVICLHHTIYGTQFDREEAFYYCSEALTAGTYNVTITRQPWFAADVGKTFQFTFASDVPEGSVLCWDGYNQSREGRNITVYASLLATTASQTAAMTEGSAGTSLGSADGTGNFNIIDRSLLGSNDWEECGMRQWLNADVETNWFTPKTNWDRIISYYTRPGFLFGFDTAFKDAILETTHKNRSNTVYDSHGTGQPYETNDKMFLLCNEEVGFASESGIVCGKTFDYYVGAENVDRIKYDIASQSTARNWFLRTPYPSIACYVRYIGTSGSLGYDYAYYGFGASPACVIG